LNRGELLLLDIEKMAHEVGLDRDEYLEVLEVYCEATSEKLEAARKALSAGDAEELAKTAHSVKGASGNLGLMDIYEKVEALEVAAMEGEILQAEDLLASVASTFEQVKAALLSLL
jgi:HPt (histidine-containing phosphotransfer) domain-containing protein